MCLCLVLFLYLYFVPSSFHSLFVFHSFPSSLIFSSPTLVGLSRSFSFTPAVCLSVCISGRRFLCLSAFCFPLLTSPCFLFLSPSPLFLPFCLSICRFASFARARTFCHALLFSLAFHFLFSTFSLPLSLYPSIYLFLSLHLPPSIPLALSSALSHRLALKHSFLPL